MKISHLNSLSFKSTPLYNVRLKKQNPDGTEEVVPATFSKLEKYDTEDRGEMRKLSYSWGGSPYGVTIASNFLSDEPEYDDDSFFAIESSNSNGARTIYSISQVNPMTHFVSYLQANPKNKSTGIKGSGEVMLWGIGRELRQDVYGGYFYLHSVPGAKGFYEQAGLKSNESFFYADQNNGPQFFENIESKYNLDKKPIL